MQLVVEDRVVLDDLNPVSPPGWWKAVDQLGGRCAVVVVRTGDVDLSWPDAGDRLRAVADTDRAVFAVLPVLTLLESAELESLRDLRTKRHYRTG